MYTKGSNAMLLYRYRRTRETSGGGGCPTGGEQGIGAAGVHRHVPLCQLYLIVKSLTQLPLLINQQDRIWIIRL